MFLEVKNLQIFVGAVCSLWEQLPYVHTSVQRLLTCHVTVDRNKTVECCPLGLKSAILLQNHGC